MPTQSRHENPARVEIQKARSAVSENLAACAAEILTWHRTTLLPDGHVSTIARSLTQIEAHDRLSIVENMINTACLEKIAGEH